MKRIPVKDEAHKSAKSAAARAGEGLTEWASRALTQQSFAEGTGLIVPPKLKRRAKGEK